MTATAVSLLAVAACAAVVDWIAVARGAKRVEYVAKPLTMAALVAVAATLDPAHPDRQVWFVVAGVLSLAGDVLLMLPRDRFLAGVAAFLAAHLCYIAGFAQGSPSGPPTVFGALLVVAAVAVVGRILVIAARRRDPRMTVPLAAYVAVISVMIVAAFAVGPGLAIAGALLFGTSDAVLAWGRFVRPLAWGPVTVMVTYHLGQTGLLLSLAQP